METPAAIEGRMQAEIEALRAQHPETQDLYREVCVLLFFRYGMTPTANKLYQLVRKGSMSAPAEALSKFWETLREKSRIRLENPDLPEPLRDVAGEMLGALWQRAQTEARQALDLLREEARAEVVSADLAVQASNTKAQACEEALGNVRAELHAALETLSATQADLAHAQGEVAALQRHADAAVAQRSEHQEALSAAQDRYTRELERLHAAAEAVEERQSAEMRRVLLEVDRERSNVAKAQRELEQTRRALNDQAELHRQNDAERQRQAERLSQRNGELEGSVAELREQRDQLKEDLANLRLRLEGVLPVKVPRARRAKPDSAVAPKTKRPLRAP